jgi:sortase B
VVLIALLSLLSIGMYAMWDSNQVSEAASMERYEVFKPLDSNESPSFDELRAINPEVFAWLNVYGTHIDYPVAQAADNMKYVNTDAEGRYSLSGSIFLDKGSSRDFSDFSSILYGHHMEDQVMFGEISSFIDRAYFYAREYGALYYDGRWHGLQFFAFLRADAYDGSVFRVKIEGREERQAYLDKLRNMADYTRAIDVTTDDHIVLLSTCSPTPTNGRDILVGKITDEVMDDPFAIIDDTDTPTAWAGKRWPRMVIILMGIAAATTLALVLNRRRRRAKDKKKKAGSGRKA